MVRKNKDAIRPVVAKPLNDAEKRNLVTSTVNGNIIDNVTKDVIQYDIKSVTNIVTKKVIKYVTKIKSINLGKREVIVKFTSTKSSRHNYNLSEDTIEKISDILGYKKAEFDDIYLNICSNNYIQTLLHHYLLIQSTPKYLHSLYKIPKIQ